MRASVLCDVGQLEVREVPCPEVGSHEVLVRVAAVGLCGTDSHIFAGHANYQIDKEGQPIPLTVKPQILGHEISGIIQEVGTEVSDLKVGDHVVLDQGLNCVSLDRSKLCEYCRTGHSHQCEFYKEHGITGLPGGLAEFISIPAVNAIQVQSDLSLLEAAMVEPLGCIIHSSDTVAKAKTRYHVNGDVTGSGQRVSAILICGGGPAGLMFLQYLREVIGYHGLLLVSEPNESKRKLALQFGADSVIDPSDGDFVGTVREHTSGRGVDYLIEASGAGEVIESITGLIRKQATVLLYGHGHAGVDLSVLNNVMFREPSLITAVGASGGFESDGRPSVYVRALDLIEQKKVDVSCLITHRYPTLEGVQSALADDIHAPDYIKGIVTL